MRVAALVIALALGACGTVPAPSMTESPTGVAATGPPTGGSPTGGQATPSADPTSAQTFSVELRNPVDPAVAREVYEEGRWLFEYDASQPLDVHQPPEPIRETDFAVIRDITYSSPKGGRVTALLILPTAMDAPVPAVVIQHGMIGSRWDLQPRGVQLAQLGVASILIDAPHARPATERLGPGTAPINFTEQDRAEQIQLIADLRRAVDLLQSLPEVDPERIGYYGVSYGGAMGGLLAGIEDRIAGYVLAVGDGGLVTNQTAPEDTEWPFADLSPAQQRAWLDLMEPIEPIYYVGQSVAPVLFQSGTRDEVVPPEDAAAYHAAGNQRSEARWYDADHGLNYEARCDAAAWLGERLGFDGSELDGCD
jgi:dienelactone hydrolase